MWDWEYGGVAPVLLMLNLVHMVFLDLRELSCDRFGQGVSQKVQAIVAGGHSQGGGCRSGTLCPWKSMSMQKC